MVQCCFKKGCDHYAEYLCLCLASETYSCEFHLEEHLKLPNRVHVFDSIFEEPYDWTKDGILSFLAREKCKKDKLNKIILTYFTENARNSESRIKRSLEYLDSDLKQITSLIEKVSNTSEPSQDLLSISLNFQLDADAENIKLMLSKDSEPYSSVWLFCILRQLRQKKSEILNIANTDPETEENFKKTCLLYQNYAFDPLINQSIEELKCDYQKMTSLYLINAFNTQTDLFIYGTVGEKEEVKIMETPKIFQYSACISQLPNGELFVIGKIDWPTICFIIDRNYKFRELPPGWPWESSLVVYFNRSVYCFGGVKSRHENTSISSRFDLDENQWIRLASMPKRDRTQSSVIFNRNIVISGYE